MEIRTNEPMARHISFRVGGPADRFMIPESETELREAVLDCKKSISSWEIKVSVARSSAQSVSLN